MAVSDVVWIQTGFIGDIVLTSGAMRKLAELAPMTRQHLITTAAGREIFENEKYVSRIVVFQKKAGLGGMLAAARDIRRGIGARHHKTAMTLQVHRSHRSSLLARMVGLPTITYQETGFAFLAKKRYPRIAVFHEKDRMALLLQGLGFTRERVLPCEVRLTAAPATKKSGCTVAIAPGSVWGTKKWLRESYAALAKRILERPETRIVLIGSGQEVEDCRFIEEYVGKSDRVENLAGKTSLTQLMQLFPTFDALVSNDSSPIHFASAFGVPTTAIFGATVPAMGFGPLAQASHVVETQLECRPCGAHGPATCPLGHFRCMREVTVVQVFAKINLTPRA